MLTQPQIEKLKAYPQMGWITALTSVAIRGLLAEGSLQLSLLDQKNLVEIQSREYPGERLMVVLQPSAGRGAETPSGRSYWRRPRKR